MLVCYHYFANELNERWKEDLTSCSQWIIEQSDSRELGIRYTSYICWEKRSPMEYITLLYCPQLQSNPFLWVEASIHGSTGKRELRNQAIIALWLIVACIQYELCAQFCCKLHVISCLRFPHPVRFQGHFPRRQGAKVPGFHHHLLNVSPLPHPIPTPQITVLLTTSQGYFHWGLSNPLAFVSLCSAYENIIW